MKSWILMVTAAAVLALTGCGGITMTNTKTPTFTIGGTVTGITAGGVLVLQNNNSNNLSVNADGNFTFANPVNSGSNYSVTVLSQPAGETCTVSNASGAATANVSNVTVTCSLSTFTIGGTVTGMTTGGVLVLQNNNGNNLRVSADGNFTFANPVNSGSNYNVTVLSQPAGETCTVSNASGTATANVNNVTVICSSSTFSIGGTVSGLITGTTLVLQNNNADNLSVTANGNFVFATRVASGSPYSVTVLNQPAGETCTVGNANGTAIANITNVTVTCSSSASFTIGGTISGLTASGLVLQDNLSDNLTVATNATSFTFSTPLANGSAYSVTVLTQPAGETCTASNNTGTVNNANVTSVVVACAVVPTFTIGGTISGLTGSGLVLQDNLTDNLTVAANATSFTFATPLPNAAPYSVTVLTQPAGQTCTPTSNTGTVNNANVTSVVITCAAASTFTIGGTITGLTASGLVLQDNLADNLTVAANATTFTFATPLTNGSAYSVTVLTQPSGETCTPSNNTGVVNNANVTSVVIACSSSTTTNQWNFINGSHFVSASGVYPSKKPGTGNPGARYGASTWIDSSGTMWLFGGVGYATSKTVESYLNDLWKFSGGVWTFVSGSNTVDQPGVYGTGGTSVPGARAFGVSWIDSTGALWLFGGYGVDSNNLNAGALNDVWKFSGGIWSWQGGSNIAGVKGTYGTQGSGDSSTIPGARYNASGAVDPAGNFWLFGGYAVDANDNPGDINDLWKFSGGVWTWVSGAKLNGQQGTYAGSAAVPGARQGQVSWMDVSNNFWVFAGNGIDSVPSEYGFLNDTWSFDVGTGQWTWQSGSNVINQPGHYGPPGDTANVPGSRYYSSGWVDSFKNVWIFGGEEVGGSFLNDLWKFNAGAWTFESGSQANMPTDPLGIYTNPGATPGARKQAASWADTSGNLWLFGGFGFGEVDSTTSPDSLNDLWEFIPGTGPAVARPASETPHAKRRRPSRSSN